MDPILPAGSTPAVQNRELLDAAQQMEAQFLSTLLKQAGLGAQDGGFASGAGETQFDSFLVEAQALQIAKSGGIGLAQMFFDALQENSHEE